MAEHTNLFHVSSSEFQNKVLNASTPVIVDFWAAWCGPCRAIAPIFERLSDRYAGKLGFAKLDVDENQDVAFTYQVQNIPTLLIFNQGQPVARLVGLLPEPRLEAEIQKVLTAQSVG